MLATEADGAVNEIRSVSSTYQNGKAVLETPVRVLAVLLYAVRLSLRDSFVCVEQYTLYKVASQRPAVKVTSNRSGGCILSWHR